MVGDTNTAREPSSFLLAVPIGREEEGGREGDYEGYRDFISIDERVVDIPSSFL